MAHTDTPNTRPQTTVTHVETSRSGGSSALWLIVGAVLALALVYFLVTGFDATGTASAPSGAETTVILNDGVSDAVEGAAGAVEGAANAVEDAATGN